MVGKFSEIRNLPPDFTEQVLGRFLVMNLFSVYETEIFAKKRENETNYQFCQNETSNRVSKTLESVQ